MECLCIVLLRNHALIKWEVLFPLRQPFEMLLCDFTLLSLVSLAVHLYVSLSRSNSSSCMICTKEWQTGGCVVPLLKTMVKPKFASLNSSICHVLRWPRGEFGLKSVKLVFQVSIATGIKEIKLLSFSSNQELLSKHCRLQVITVTLYPLCSMFSPLFSLYPL